MADELKLVASSQLRHPIDLSRVKKVRGGRIIRVGLELEGGWDSLPQGVRLAPDGSVKFPELPIQPLQRGELNSHPMVPNEVSDWMKAVYPKYVNATCGMHAHLSTMDLFYYQLLMRVEYPSTIIKYMAKWAKENLPADHCIWPRLRGESEYCQHIFAAEDQVLHNRKEYDHHAKGHRYTVVNYCWRRYNTLECRLLPMMPNPTLAAAAIKELIDITERFLVASIEKEPKTNHKIELAENALEESYQFEVPASVDSGRINISL